MMRVQLKIPHVTLNYVMTSGPNSLRDDRMVINHSVPIFKILLCDLTVGRHSLSGSDLSDESDKMARITNDCGQYVPSETFYLSLWLRRATSLTI